MEVVDIEDDDLLYRRIAPEFIKPNGELASPVYMRDGRPDDAVSVDLARFTSPAESAARGPRATGYTLAAIRAGDLRGQGFTVRHDPQPDNPAHALIDGVRSKADIRRLLAITTIVSR